MRFLCLPGAYGSAKNFGVQLGPFAKHMEDRGLATFAFTQGEHEVEPPLGWENYFGSRPLYRFLDAAEGDAFEVVRRVRHIPRGLTPEATLRLFQPDGGRQSADFDWTTFRAALDRLLKAIDDDPEIDGLIGYSEGAMMAACICAEENKRWEEMGVPRRIKFAIFFAGTPPLVREGSGFAAKLADEHGTVIKIPTFHVFGSNDPLVYSSVALYNCCDPDAAQLYDHGLGHLVPRDADNVEQLGDTLSDVITRINNEQEDAAKSKDGVDAVAAAAAETTPISKFADEYITSSSSSAESSAASGSTAESDLDSRSSHGLESEAEGIAKIHLK
ncbi:serine hydrolase-domain-containing protein [Hypoxylon cercidicola]|nr:serine hydrolase-domain-containing protein [Hypoxylon cercidicola]